MAEFVLSVVAEGILAKAMSLASEHIGSAWGFKEELRKLQVSLTKIQAVIHDAEKRQISDESVKTWLLELKDVAYEADNVLDEFGYEILHQKVESQKRKKVRSFFSPSNPIVFPFKMGNKIRSINQSLDRIKTNVALLGLRESSNPIPKIGLDRETDSFIDDSEVVVRGDDVLKIVNLLIGANNQRVISVIPIVDGMGRLRTVFFNRVDLGDKLLEFKCVRGLSLYGPCIKELPKSIGKLRHLRLLCIKDTYIKLIPNSVSMLYNLQTLVIKDCHFLKELPKDLQNLINLRHIDIDHCYIKQLPINMGQLTCLQTLPLFIVGQDVGCRIEELGCLSQLRGKVYIYNLEHVRDKEEGKTANLAEKPKVHKLGLHWRSWRKREGNNNDEDVLEGLQPHPNLKSLKIEYFNGEKFPSWLLRSDNIRGGLLLFDHLLEFCLSYCRKCEKIPTLGHLPSLKVLRIGGMDNVRCIGTEFYNGYNGEGSSNSRGGSGSTVLFPALETFILNSMHNLVEWTEPTAEIGMIFPRLEYLKVSDCEKLIGAPRHFPSLKELSFYKIRGSAFEKIISELTTLTSLKISEISELACLPEHFLQKNRSLVDLRIGECADLESILPHEHVWPICTSLRSLSINGCDKLSTLPDALHNLHCLEKFEVNCCRNLRSFPSISSFLQNLLISCSDEVLPVLQSCMSLQNLIICNCPRLISIPDLRNLHSLTYLEIYSCPDLISIPDLKELPSLAQLEIWDCSNLILIPDLKEYPSLTQLKISGCSNLISIPDIHELHSLTHLGIRQCQKLRGVPDGLDCLTHLKCLWIGDICKEFNSFPSLNSILHSYAPLQRLHLYGWDSLNSLPEAIKYFTALQILEISEFGEMNSLPDWLGNLSSLQTLYIYNCKNMKYLPTTQAMRRLIKLEQLEIWRCPKLEKRCAEGSGAEWSKIAHILYFSSNAWSDHFHRRL
nr:putative disease resistance rpp13-like protein 1 [Quercus suber]